MKSCVVMGAPDDRWRTTDGRVGRQRPEDGFPSSVPLSSVLCFSEIRAGLNKSGAAAALQQRALAGSARGGAGHADVVRRVGGAGREGSDRGGGAGEVELEGAGRYRHG